MLQAQYHPSPKDQARVAQMFAQHMNAEVQVPDRNGGAQFPNPLAKIAAGQNSIAIRAAEFSMRHRTFSLIS